MGLTPEPTTERKYKFRWMKLPDLFELYGTTLGSVGFGEIACEVARRARAFGMSMLYTKRQRLTPEAEAQELVTYKDLPNLLAEGDFVSLHVPHTPATDGLIDNVLLAPHIGGGSGGAGKKHACDPMRNLERAAKGERPQHTLE